MVTLTTDVAIIGAGTAGLNARREVELANKRFVLIEAGQHGTMCARTGCMPSKLLIAAGEAAQRVRRAKLFGIHVASDAVRIDGRAVLERVRRERDRFVELNARSVRTLPPEQSLQGLARFESEHELMVGEHTRVRASAVVIATGSRPIIPKELESLGERLLTSDTLFELTELPESIAVFGTGAIGLELGQALQHLGVRVAFYNPFDALGPFTDPVVAERFRAVMAADLDLCLRAQALEARVEANAVVIRHKDAEGRAHERRFTYALAAVGRRPNLESLELAKTGLALDQKGMPPFSRETARCGESSIFMAGDVNGIMPILHEASDDGRIAGANAAKYPEVTPHARRVPLQIAFTSPQLAMVGATHREVSEGACSIGEVSFEDQGRARIMAENRGHVRLYGDRETRRLLGAEMFGPAVEHTAHLLAWAVQQHLTVDALLRMPYYHPTLEEGIRTAIRDLGKALEYLDDCSAEQRSESPAD